MDNRGLQSSRWARSTQNHGYQSLSTEWVCPSCGFANFSWRKDCFRCPPLVPEISSGGEVENTRQQHQTVLPIPEMLHEPASRTENQGRAGHHGTMTATVVEPIQDPRLYNGGRGLATSRWAPRNPNGRSTTTKSGEVWTRLAPPIDPRSDKRSISQPPRANYPELGLPYEVQHFILSMMQRILEEGTYSFAARWLPDELDTRRWTCSEAVELSTWREVLPDVISPESLVTIADYTLVEGLRDAVKVRNAATHRHLCDNTEIRDMAARAQDLMAMFSDSTRQNKFERLRRELADWDAASRHDMDAAQDKLQRALQEINERPLDDMDWTPNAVSLRELTPDVITVPVVTENFDEMDLDME